MIAPIGGNDDAIFIAIREFKLDRVILVATNDKSGYSESLASDLANFSIPTEIMIVTDMFNDLFKTVAESKEEILINTSSGDNISNIAALSTAFINGTKAFYTSGSKAVMLPIMDISYHELLKGKKREILKNLKDNNLTLKQLAKKTSISLPLLSYHLNGTLKFKGLKSLGLVKVIQQGGMVVIGLTDMGKLLVYT